MRAFCALLMKEGVSKEEEVLTAGRAFVEARALARASGRCCHPVMRPSFCNRRLERGRGRAACAHQLSYEQNPFPRGRVASRAPGHLPDLWSAWPLALWRFSRRGLAPPWKWTARNAAMPANGRSDVGPDATWRKEARVYMFSPMKGCPVVQGAFLDRIRYFLSSSKPDPPRSNGGRFRSGYLHGERRAGGKWTPRAGGDCSSRRTVFRSCDACPLRIPPEAPFGERNGALWRNARARFEWKLPLSRGLRS